MHWESNRQILFSGFAAVFLLFSLAPAGAQECYCPLLTDVTAQSGGCLLGQQGDCVICEGSSITFTIHDGVNLPYGGQIRWYSDTFPDFNPWSGQGTLRHVEVVPSQQCGQGNAVRINEFQPIPVVGNNNYNDPETGEWIEIIGPPGAYIGCYVITDGDWTVTIPPNTYLPPSGLYVIGYARYGKVDLDVATCNCKTSSLPNETLILDDQGEYLVLWNGFAFVDQIKYGNPSLANNPPFGNLVTLGTLPTAGLPGCVSQLSISYPMFTNFNLLPFVNYTYEREPDLSGPWKREFCGSRGRCNVETGNAFPISWTFDATNEYCNQTLYFKAIIVPAAEECLIATDSLAAGPFAFTINCPSAHIAQTLCPGDSIVVAGVTYNQANPAGTAVLTSFYGCDSLVQVDLQFSPDVDVQFEKDTTICIGESVLLNVSLMGAGPFEFNLNANGADGGMFISNGQFAINISPTDTSFFTLNNIKDQFGCSGFTVDSIWINVNDPVASIALNRSLICTGDSTGIVFTGIGGAPFDVTYAVGSDTLFDLLQSGAVIPVNPVDTSVIALVKVLDHLGCEATLTGDAIVNVTMPPEVKVSHECSPDKMTYTIFLEFTGGISSAYEVTGVSGSLSGNLWQSDPQPSKSTYQLFAGDSGPCALQMLTAIVDCDCQTDAGTFASFDTLQICPGQLTGFSWLTPPSSLSGDTVLFYLYQTKADPIGSAIAINTDGTFGYQSGWPLNTTFWLSAIVSRKGPGGIDPTDPCYKVGDPIPVIFRELPTMQLNLPQWICGTSCEDATINVQGFHPVSVSWQWGDPSSPVNGAGTSSTGTVTANMCGPGLNGQVPFTVTQFSDRYCTNSNTQSYQIPYVEPVALQYSYDLCYGESVVVHGTPFQAMDQMVDFTLPASGPMACDTNVNVVIRAIIPDTGTLALTLCQGSAYSIGGQIFDETKPSGYVVFPAGASSGCDSVLFVNIQFDNFVVHVIQTTLCPGESIIAGGETFDASNPTGTVTLAGASYLGCDSIIQVALSFYDDITLVLSGGGVVCRGDSIDFFLQGPAGAYDIVIVRDGANPISLTGIVPGVPIRLPATINGTYMLNSASLPGLSCPVNIAGQANVTVETIQAIIQPALLYNGSVISCTGAFDGMLLASAPGGSLPISFTWNDNVAGPARNGLGAGQYTVSVVSANGCLDSASFVVQDPLPMQFQALVTGRVCGLDYIVINDFHGGTGVWSWSVDQQTWHPFPGASAFPIDPGPGTHRLYIRDANGCMRDTLITLLDRSIKLYVDAWPDTTVYAGQPVQLEMAYDTSGAGTYTLSWHPTQYLSCNDCPDPVARPKRDMTYEVRVTDAFGCYSSAWVDILLIFDEDYIYTPTAFSPNQDDINDTFLPMGDGDSYLITSGAIFDRWGNMLWQIEDCDLGNMSRGWDGYALGKPMDPGMYIYAFTIRNKVTGNETFLKGDVTLIR